MIRIKSKYEVELMRRAGRIAGMALLAGGRAVRPGTTTKAINAAVHAAIEEAGATPSFLHYNGFPASACISVNDEVIHGIPGDRIIHEGDIVSIDVGACYKGYHGDCANTFGAGEISDEAKRLIEVTRQSFYEGIKFARGGQRISDVSHAIQQTAEDAGFHVVREYVGHGVGAHLHEEPEVPNYGSPGRGVRLMPGMTIAIEPMINYSTKSIKVLKDGWTVITADGGLSAHYENSVLITDGEPELLTLVE